MMKTHRGMDRYRKFMFGFPYGVQVSKWKDKDEFEYAMVIVHVPPGWQTKKGFMNSQFYPSGDLKNFQWVYEIMRV